MEEWRDVPGVEHLQCTRDARFRVLPHTMIRKNGRPYRVCGGERAPHFSAGRMKLTHKYRVHKVARLLLLTWVGQPPSGKGECSHKNDVKADDRLENLEWASRGGNARRASQNGLLKGANTGRRLSHRKADEIRGLLSDGMTYGAIAERYGVSSAAIGHVARGLTWRRRGST